MQRATDSSILMAFNGRESMKIDTNIEILQDVIDTTDRPWSAMLSDREAQQEMTHWRRTLRIAPYLPGQAYHGCSAFGCRPTMGHHSWRERSGPRRVLPWLPRMDHPSRGSSRMKTTAYTLHVLSSYTVPGTGQKTPKRHKVAYGPSGLRIVLIKDSAQ
jgi:hypothetical protein